MKKYTFLLILVLAIAFVMPCYAVDSNEYNDFIRVVRDGKLYKDQISPSMSFDTDADNINTIIKNNVTTGTYTGDNTVGNVLKGYVQSGVSIGGNSEIVGAATILLNDATQAGGTKSAVHSFHVHADTSTTPDFGLRFFGDVTSDIFQFASSSAADGIDMRLATLTGQDLVLSNEGTIDDDAYELIMKKVVDGTLSDKTAGCVVKSYMNDAAVSVGGNSEFVGLGVFAKQLASMAGGSKSAIISGHQHADSTVNMDRGLALFGDVTNALYISGANTNFLQTPDSSSAGYGSGSLDNSDAGDIKCDAYLTLDIGGTAYYLPLYNTKHS